MCNNQLPEGFIPWYGGDNPVPGKFVRIKLQGGYTTPDDRKERANAVKWRHVLNSGNVIGYKVVEDTPAPAPFSTKFVIGKEYKTRAGDGPFKLVAIVPEAKYPLIFLGGTEGLYYSRYKDGHQYPTGEDKPGDMMLPKRTVYVNLYINGGAAQYRTRDAAEKAVRDYTHLCNAIAVPVEIEG